MENRTVYITVRVDLEVPNNPTLADAEIADDFVKANIELSEDSYCNISDVQICGVNDV